MTVITKISNIFKVFVICECNSHLHETFTKSPSHPLFCENEIYTNSLDCFTVISPRFFEEKKSPAAYFLYNHSVP